MGQSHVVRALSHALDGDKLHPAILLTGTRGVGKTTLARIVAKGLNCGQGVSASPCGQCQACSEVDGGRFMDLLEIDAASHTGVDNVRELIDNAQYSPVRGRYKVYLIDEVHMLSKSAFNALLKMLEEPPAHVKFILATTDPQRLPVTVLSRCLQFNLRRLPSQIISDQLARIMDSEALRFEAPALQEIARAADGSMRDGLSLLDQAIAYAGDAALSLDQIQDMLGTAGREAVEDLLQAIADGDGARLMQALAEVDQQAPDYAALITDLAAQLQRIAVIQQVADARQEDDSARLLALADRLSAEDVQLYYQIAVSGRRDLPWAPDPRSGLEMTLLRMLAFRPAGGGSGERRTSSATVRRSEPAPSAATTNVSEPTPMPKLAADASWSERVKAMQLDGPSRQLARQCAWLGERGDEIRLGLAVTLQYLHSAQHEKAIAHELTRQLGRSVNLRIEIQEDQDGVSPARQQADQEAAARTAAQAAILADPQVQAFTEQFGARLRPDSVSSSISSNQRSEQ